MNGLERKQPRLIALVVLLQNISVSHSSFDFRVFVHGSVLLICYHHLSGKQGKSHTPRFPTGGGELFQVLLYLGGNLCKKKKFPVITMATSHCDNQCFSLLKLLVKSTTDEASQFETLFSICRPDGV